jgi:stage II sporulation protein R
VLKENGFTYTSRASIRQEEFPTRTYGDFTLESGVYDALIVELGTGEGDNWWCVIYPPLCFTAGNGNVTYISAIQQIIKKWKNSLSV